MQLFYEVFTWKPKNAGNHVEAKQIMDMPLKELTLVRMHPLRFEGTAHPSSETIILVYKNTYFMKNKLLHGSRKVPLIYSLYPFGETTNGAPEETIYWRLKALTMPEKPTEMKANLLAPTRTANLSRPFQLTINGRPKLSPYELMNSFDLLWI